MSLANDAESALNLDIDMELDIGDAASELRKLDTTITNAQEAIKKARENHENGVFDPVTLEWPAYNIPSIGSRYTAAQEVIDDPLPTPRRRTRQWYFLEFGIIGLWTYDCYTVQQWVKDGDSHPTWLKVLEDQKKLSRSRMLFYYSTVHPEAIIHWIRGDLAHEMMQNRSFSRTVKPYLELRKRQGTYAIATTLVAPQVPFASSSDEHDNPEDVNIGAGLSRIQWIQVSDKLRKYCATRDDDDPTPDTIQLRKSIECAFRVRQNIRYDENEFFYQKNDLADIENWLDKIDDAFLDHARQRHRADPEDPWLFIPIPWSPCYVGLSYNPLQRAPEHWVHKGDESLILGAFTGAVEVLFPGQFGMQQSTFQIFSTVDAQDIGPDEVYASIFASGMPLQLGLCNTEPGIQIGSSASIHRKENAALRAAMLQENALKVKESGFVKVNIEHSVAKIENWRKCLLLLKYRSAVRRVISERLDADLETSRQLEPKVERLKVIRQLHNLRKAAARYAKSRSNTGHD